MPKLLYEAGEVRNNVMPKLLYEAGELRNNVILIILIALQVFQSIYLIFIWQRHYHKAFAKHYNNS